MAQKKSLTIEEGFAQIEEKIDLLSREDISLEEAFKNYAEGVQLLKDCNASIDAVEKKVLKLSADGSTENFE